MLSLRFYYINHTYAHTCVFRDPHYLQHYTVLTVLMFPNDSNLCLSRGEAHTLLLLLVTSESVLGIGSALLHTFGAKICLLQQVAVNRGLNVKTRQLYLFRLIFITLFERNN